METRIIKKERTQECEIGDLIITSNEGVDEFVAIYGGIDNLGKLNEQYVYYPLHSMQPKTQVYRGIQKNALITSEGFKFRYFYDSLKIIQGDSAGLINSILLVTDIDKRELYYGFCSSNKINEEKHIWITPIRMIADMENIVGKRLILPREICSIYKESVTVSNKF